MAKLNDLTGKQFGNWKVLYRNGSTPNKAAIWRCKCLLCGAESDVVGASLYNGRSTKCRACVPRQTLKKPHRNEKIYTIYSGMMQRCYNKNNSHYPIYGGRGISVCDEWFKNPDAFFEWAFENGYQTGLSIDRIDNSKGYSPENCRWVAPCAQAQNRRMNVYVTYNNYQLCLAEACRQANISYNALRSYRSTNKCTPQEAFDHYVNR